MNKKIGGIKARPRVAVVGKFDDEVIEKFKKLFPTIWTAFNFDALDSIVDKREIDLIIIGGVIEKHDEWANHCHVICFSRSIDFLPGPIKDSRIRLTGKATTREFLKPEIPLAMDRQRSADLIGVEDIREWFRIAPITPHSRGYWVDMTVYDEWEGWDTFWNGAILIENVTKDVLAVDYVRDSKLGVAYFPNGKFDRVGWVNVIVSKWAKIDKESFPNFGDWTSSPKWMMKDEEQIYLNISALEEKKLEVIDEIDKKIGEEQNEIAKRKSEIDLGRRRLITAQGDELVEEVILVLEIVGFKVKNMDEESEEGSPKVEDLRIRDPNDKDWEGIVEVRGYARSAGTTKDFLRLGRFADLYRNEKGCFPDKRVYIINGQIELPPDQRQEPWSSANEDVKIFSESNGLVIWTLDLFQAMKFSQEDNYDLLKESIKISVGRWRNPH